MIKLGFTAYQNGRKSVCMYGESRARTEKKGAKKCLFTVTLEDARRNIYWSTYAMHSKFINSHAQVHAHTNNAKAP